MNRSIKGAISAACLAIAGISANVQADNQVHDSLLNTLDDLLFTAETIEMPPEVQAQILITREQIQMADPAGFETLPSNLLHPVALMELNSAQLRLYYETPFTADPRSKTPDWSTSVQSTGADYDDAALDTPAYPNISWNFTFSDPGEPEDGGDHGGSGSSGGICKAPGYSTQTRFIANNVAITLHAIKDIAEQGCNQSGLGFNASLACIVTDIAAFVAIGVDSNQELCNDFMTAAEVTATWEGLNAVHGNLQHVHDDLADVDADVADVDADLVNHDGDIKTLLDEVLANQGGMLANQETIIDLLKTPAGRRPDWNK